MPKFLTIGYGDEAGYNRTPQAVRDAGHAHDERLRKSGALIGVLGAPVHVRNPEGKGVEQTAGAFMRSDLPIAGIALIEAADIDAAIKQIAEAPCAMNYGVVEVWPIKSSP